MIDRLLPSLTFLAAISCGLAAGIFYAFSSLVMRALAKIPPPAGIAAMQSINVSVVNPWFIAAFFGPAVICCVLGVISLARWNREGNAYLFAGSAFYAQRFRSGNSHFLNDYIFFWNILMSA